MTKDEIEQAMKEALVDSLNAFAEQHPATWTAICRKANNNPGGFFWAHLERDAAYQALLEQTDGEVKLAAILKIAMSTIFKFAPLLLGMVTL
jgi:hypothetical protein